MFKLILFFFLSLSEISTVPDFQILGVQPSIRADEDAQYHHLLDNAMFDPRRRVWPKEKESLILKNK